MRLLLRHLWLVARVGSRHLGLGRGGLQAAAVLAAGGLAAGTATLLVVLAVMNGFQLGFIENIVEIGSYHVRVAPGGQSSGAGPAAADRAAFAARLAGVDGVSAAVPFAELPALVSPSGGAGPGASRGLVLRVVPPDVRRLDAGFARRVRMVAGEFAVQEPGSAVVGAELAAWLGVRPGDTVAIFTLDGAAAGAAGLQPRHLELVVTGIFRSGLYEYDLSWAFVGPATLLAAAPRTQFVYGIKLANRFRDAAAQTALAAAVAPVDPAARVQSWRVFNRALFAALRVEKLLLTVILGLVFLVVAYNVLQGLRRRVLERGMEIGLLRAVGAPPWVVRAVFVWEGALLGILGAGVGTALGLLMAYNLDGVFGLLATIANAALALAALVPGSAAAPAPVELFSPQTFYLDEVPSRLIVSEVVLVAGFAAAAPAASGLLAAARAARVAAAAALRAE